MDITATKYLVAVFVRQNPKIVLGWRRKLKRRDDEKSLRVYNFVCGLRNHKREIYKEVKPCSILMTYTVYHTRNGIVSIMSCLRQNIEEKRFVKRGGKKWERS